MKKQKGLTLISWLAIIGLLLFNAIIASLEMNYSLRGTTTKKIKETIAKRLRVNNVYSISKDDIKLLKSKKGYVVSIDYEPRGKLIGSLDYIVSFSHEAIIPIR